MVVYLLSSLPSPRLGEAPAMRVEEFLERCRRFLAPTHMADLDALLAPEREAADEGSEGESKSKSGGKAEWPGPRHPAARTWVDLDTRVQDAVVLERCARSKLDAMPFLRQPDRFRPDVTEAVAEAFSKPHPAERERALDRLRWDLADELAETAPIGFAALLARLIQVRLAWRWMDWNAEAGWAAVEASLKEIEERHG